MIITVPQGLLIALAYVAPSVVLVLLLIRNWHIRDFKQRRRSCTCRYGWNVSDGVFTLPKDCPVHGQGGEV